LFCFVLFCQAAIRHAKHIGFRQITFGATSTPICKPCQFRVMLGHHQIRRDKDYQRRRRPYICLSTRTTDQHNQSLQFKTPILQLEDQPTMEYGNARKTNNNSSNVTSNYQILTVLVGNSSLPFRTSINCRTDQFGLQGKYPDDVWCLSSVLVLGDWCLPCNCQRTTVTIALVGTISKCQRYLQLMQKCGRIHGKYICTSPSKIYF
jgi:hypothetical protein